MRVADLIDVLIDCKSQIVNYRIPNMMNQGLCGILDDIMAYNLSNIRYEVHRQKIVADKEELEHWLIRCGFSDSKYAWFNGERFHKPSSEWYAPRLEWLDSKITELASSDNIYI